jgi:hypothetical protein
VPQRGTPLPTVENAKESDCSLSEKGSDDGVASNRGFQLEDLVKGSDHSRYSSVSYDSRSSSGSEEEVVLRRGPPLLEGEKPLDTHRSDEDVNTLKSIPLEDLAQGSDHPSRHSSKSYDSRSSSGSEEEVVLRRDPAELGRENVQGIERSPSHDGSDADLGISPVLRGLPSCDLGRRNSSSEKQSLGNEDDSSEVLEPTKYSVLPERGGVGTGPGPSPLRDNVYETDYTPLNCKFTQTLRRDIIVLISSV